MKIKNLLLAKNIINIIGRFTVFCTVAFTISSININAQNNLQDSLHIGLNLKKILTLEENIRRNDSMTSAKLLALESSITNQNFVKTFKKSNIEKFKNDVSSLKSRYIVGEEVLDHIIKETNSFNIMYKNLILHTEYSTITNPVNYSYFTSSLSETMNSLQDKKPLPDITSDINDISKKIPYLNNPIVSNSLSIASFFIAKYNDKRRIDSEKFQEMMCILNFTSNTHAEYHDIVQQIKYLNEKIAKFNNNSREFATRYLSTINYNDGYTQYKNIRNSSPVDFLEPRRQIFFNTILADTNNVGIVAISTDRDDEVCYYIEQIKYYIIEYESILKEIDNSISSYKEFYRKLEKNVNNSCPSIKDYVAPKLPIINRNLTDVDEAFESIMNDNQLSAQSKRKLFGL